MSRFVTLHRNRRIAALIAGIMSLAMTAFNAQAEEDWRIRGTRLAADNLARTNAPGDPLTMPMTVCRDTVCTVTSQVQLSPEQAGMIRATFTDGAATPAIERSLIGHAIAHFETFVGAQNDTWRDHARNLRQSEDEGGQMDCVSESINTLTYLGRLSRAGLLTHHDLGGFVMRYLIVLQHVAVEVIERQSGDSFVIDSWVGENGEEPEIEPYGTWRMEWLA